MSCHLIIYYEGHHGGEELEEEGQLQLGLPEVLGLDHLPGGEAQRQHTQQQVQYRLLTGQTLLLHLGVIVGPQFRRCTGLSDPFYIRYPASLKDVFLQK